MGTGRESKRGGDGTGQEGEETERAEVRKLQLLDLRCRLECRGMGDRIEDDGAIGDTRFLYMPYVLLKIRNEINRRKLEAFNWDER